VGHQRRLLFCAPARATQSLGSSGKSIVSQILISQQEHLETTEYIFVCPQFLHAFSAAPLAQNCPDIQNNKMVPNWDKFSDSMYGIIIHELAHIYGIYQDVDMNETYKIQDAADLRASYQIKNAANYAFYASGELYFL